MSASAPDRRRTRMVLASVVAAACAATVAILAVASPGYAGSSVTATTRIVWVTNSTDFLLGRINRQIDELDSAAALSSADFDVLQDGRAVFAVDRSAHQLRRVDPATVTLSEPLDLPRSAVVALGGGVLAIGDEATGRVWTVPAADIGTGAVDKRAPAATVAPGVVLAVGANGMVAATAPGQRRLTLIGGPAGDTAAGDSSGSRAVPLARTLSASTPSRPAPVSIAMVGNSPVVLDGPAGALLVGDRVLPLPRGTTGATLQQSGPAADAALVATPTALLRVTLSDGTVGTFATGTSGPPAAPVWLGGCAHGAWSGSRPTYLAWCGAEPTIRPIPVAAGHPAVGSLVFRVNGSEIVLNDIATGDTWMLDPQMTVVNNWSQVAPPHDDRSQQAPNSGKENDSDQVSLSRTNCTGPVTPPVASPDTFGVRAGEPTIVPVMANDATTDCSAVVIDQVSALPDGTGQVAVVDAGRALQVTAAATATGALPPITYRLDDGAGHHSEATVHLQVVPPQDHPAPQRLRGSATMVGVGGTVTDNVLADWYSPAGDPLWLTAVNAQGQDLAVGFEPGGAVTVHDTGTGGTGKKTVTFALTDGVSVAHGTLSVQVVAAADAAPIASPVYAVTTVGRPVTLRPLDSVLNPGTDPAALSAVAADPVGGKVPATLTVAMSAAAGTATVSATAPGDYQLHYQVSAGTTSAVGVIRVLVVDGPPPPPVAVTDVGYLAPDGQVRLDLTANDIAPGGALAVQDLQIDPNSPLVVTLSGMHIAHISARRPLPAGGTWFSYTASDGSASATGRVHIVPVAQAPDEGPVASPAQMTVRAGDAGTLPVGQVALDRDGNAMTVQPFTPLPASQGLLFASGDTIRYLAPQTAPGTVSAVYTVTDTAGRSDSAPLHITVIPRGRNRPPATPPTTVARVFAGGDVTIPLPLDGIDPDGDWVTAGTITQQGKLGTATVSGPDAIRYRARGDAGLDTVRYQAADPFHADSTGTITVLVVPQPAVAQPPVAPDLKVAVAPGHSIGVDVLGAVSDPADLQVQFAASGAVTVPAGSGVTARVQDGVLAVTAGPKPAVVPVGYTVVNSRGLSASGVVTVTVTPDAEPIPPTASDVFVDTTMVSPDGTSAVVDVGDHVTNLGGRQQDLQISLPAVDPASARRSGRLQATVALTGSRQVIAYRVTNADKQAASAFIVVPTNEELSLKTADDKPARLAPGQAQPLTVDAGKVALVDVNTYVSGAPPGTSLSLPAGSRPTVDVGTISRADATHLRWDVPRDAKGSATIGATVTDGSATAGVDIQATIRPAIPPAPAFVSTNVTVAAGGSTVVHLAPLVTPGSKDQHLTFAGPTGAGNGISATRSGSTLTISANGTARKGSRVTLAVSVSDGVHPPVPATIGVTVVASTAPPAWIPDIARNGEQGVRQTVDVLAGATNPVPKKGPLRVVAAKVIQGQGQVSFAAGGAVSITPGATQVGTLAVQVSVQDATGDPDRIVTGTVTVTVVGRPGQVTGVGLVSSGDRFVELKWTAPADNGRPIDHYLVRATSGSYQHQCPAAPTRCRLTGLANNVTYRFTVTAHNAVGNGAASAASPPATPDVAPDAPAAPTLSFGDGSIAATWTRPVDRGSPVTGYLVTISPAPASGPATAKVTDGTSHTFTGLTNGTSYQVTVVAQNSSGKDSDPSAPATMVPAAVPDVPQPPGLTYDSGASTVAVTWTAPAGNGDDAISYGVAWTGDDGSSGTATVAAGKPLSATISPAKLGVTYTATVTATNKAGTSKASAPGTAKAFVAVGPPANVKATATGADRTVAVTWTAPAYSGWDLGGYQYQLDGAGAWASLPVETSATITSDALTNGAAHTISIRACTQQSADACGAAAASNEVAPYGPIAAPQVSASGSSRTSVTFSWPPPADNGFGHPYTYRLGGNATGSTTQTSTSVPTSCGTSVSISVVAVDTQGHVGPAGTASGTAAACPPTYPTGTVTRNGAPTFASLYNLTPDGNLGPNGSAQIKCWNPAQLIASDAGNGWFKLASGPYSGQWTAANNFRNWQSLKSQVAGTSCPKT